MRYTKGACPPIACGHASFAFFRICASRATALPIRSPFRAACPWQRCLSPCAGRRGAIALPVEPEASLVEQRKRGKDHAHGQGLAAAEPLVKQPDTQQGDQHDGAHAVGGVGDDGRHIVER